MVSKVLLHSPVMKSTVGTMFTSSIASWWGHPGHIIDIARRGVARGGGGPGVPVTPPW